MSTKLEEAAQLIASQRREAGKQQFESTYAELLPALKGSTMFYQAVTSAKGSLDIVFSKPGIPKLTLPLLADGKVGRGAPAVAMGPEALTTLLADYIVNQENSSSRRVQIQEDIKFNQRWLGISLGLLSALFLAGLLLNQSDSTQLRQLAGGPILGFILAVLAAMTASFGVQLIIATNQQTKLRREVASWEIA